MNRMLRYLIALLIPLLLVSCGGGGGGGEAGYSISLDKSALSFNVVFGRVSAPSQTVTATYKGDGVIVGFPPDIEAPPWLRIISTSTNTGSVTFKLSITETTTPYPPGSYTTSVRFVTGSASSGETVYRDLPVTIKIKGPSATQPKVLFSDNKGVAFTSLPGLSNLSQIVTLRTNASTLGSLTALSDASWLNTSSLGNQLTLTANPAGLADGLHYARVTVTSNTAGMSTETIRVGLFVGSTAPGEGSALPVTATNPYNVVVDPIRPWLYESTTNGIKATNIYTGAVDFTSDTLGFSPGNLMTSADGRWIFARTGAGNYHRLDMESNTWTSFSIPQDTDSTNALYLRPTGHDLLLTDRGIVIDPVNGSFVSQNQFQSSFSDLILATSGDLQRIATVEKGLSGLLRPTTHQAVYYPADDIFMVTILGNGYDSISFAQDLAMNHDGSRIVLAAGAPYNILQYAYSSASGMSLLNSLPVSAYPRNALIDKRNTVYGSNGGSVKAFNASGTLIATFSAYPANGYRGLQISSDGLFLIIMTPSGANKAVIYRTVE